MFFLPGASPTQSKSAPMEQKHDIRWYEEVDSTNNEMIRLSERLDNLSVIAAVFQTGGRGQRGNKWHSCRGENLTFSILLRFGIPSDTDPRYYSPLPAADQFKISELATIAQCRFLERNGIKDARIKWPNDIYVSDRKISGMLVENSLSGKHVRTSVVGIGLNVNQTVFPDWLPNPVSMAIITGMKYNTEELLSGFMDVFREKLTAGLADGGGLKDEYESLMYRRGTESEFADLSSRPAYLPANPLVTGTGTGIKADGTVFRGTITGITDSGLLSVRLENGSVKHFGFKEIAYII